MLLENKSSIGFYDRELLKECIPEKLPDGYTKEKYLDALQVKYLFLEDRINLLQHQYNIQLQPEINLLARKRDILAVACDLSCCENDDARAMKVEEMKQKFRERGVQWWRNKPNVQPYQTMGVSVTAVSIYDVRKENK